MILPDDVQYWSYIDVRLPNDVNLGSHASSPHTQLRTSSGNKQTNGE